jgi:hypothetical protein
MALAAALSPGLTYLVTEGPLAGEAVEIISNKAVPDGLPNQRKVLVSVGGHQHYILPRQIDSVPILHFVDSPEAGSFERHVAEQNAAAQARTEAIVAEALEEAALIRPAANAMADLPITEAIASVVYADITDPMDPRLDHLRPSITKTRQYVNREVHGMKDVDFLLTFASDVYRAQNQGLPASFMLKGDTQGGKTMLVEVLAVAWAEVLGYPKPMPIFTLSGSSGVTDFDLFGQPAPYYDPITGRESIIWLPGVVELAARVGGLLYLDECNAMGERVTTSLHSVVDHRHCFTNRNKPVPTYAADGVTVVGFMPEVITLSKNTWVIGTFNEGYRGMSAMNEAFVNRFRHIEWGYDSKVEKFLVGSPTIHLLADALRVARTQGKLRTPVGTAALQRLDLDVRTFGVDLALDVFVSAFSQQERDIVRTIVTDRSIDMLLREEHDAAQAQEEGAA